MSLEAASAIGQIITGAGSLVVAALAIRASRQISSQQHALSLSTTRAYVTPESGHVTTLQPGKPIEVFLTAKNWGQTPALKVRVASHVYLLRTPDPTKDATPLFIEPNKAAITLPPLEMLEIRQSTHSEAPLTADDLRSISDGTVKLCCKFLIEYHDILNQKHQTSIRYFWTGQSSVDTQSPLCA